MDSEKIGNLIKDIRNKNNLTQKEFADKYNVTYQAVSKWENGKNLPDITLLHQICRDFNINFSELVGEVNNKKKLLEYLESGYNAGLISDRGTPIISDPGYSLAKFAIESGFNVVSLPGPTALIPALTSSGLNPMPFCFYGFLNSKDSERKKELEELKNINMTIIIYEAPHRINKTLKDIEKILGNNRKISISREISKKYEEIYRGTVSDLLVENNEYKGELVIVIEGNKENYEYKNLTIEEHVKFYINDGMKDMDAIKMVAKERNMKKSEIYDIYHNLGEK